MKPQTRVQYHSTFDSVRKVWRSDGHIKHVKNLGWLLRNARYAICLQIRPSFAEGCECQLAVEGSRNGRQFTFVCDFVSHAVCTHFISRPCLSHVHRRASTLATRR